MAEIVPFNNPPPENSGGGGGGTIDERLARLETHMGYVVTKADLKDLENTIIKEINNKTSTSFKWMVGTLITVSIALVSIVFRLFG